MNQFFSNKRAIVNALVALMICASSMAVVIDSNGIVILTILISYSIILLVDFRNFITTNYARSLLVSLLVVFLFLITMFFHQEPVVQDYFLHFICFGIPFLFLPITSFDMNKVFRYICLLSLLFLPFYLTYNYGYEALGHNNGYDDGLLMTMSYRIVPFIIANFSCCFFHELNKTKKIFFSILAIIYTVLLSVIGSRGALVSVFVFLLLSYLQNGSTKIVRQRRLFCIGVVILLFMVSFNFIIQSLFDFFSSQDVSVLALNRMAFGIEHGGSMTSGRESIYIIAINDFFSSPIWGTGIGAFDNYQSYPHNVFLQIMQEGGLLLFIPFVMLFFKGFGDILLKKNDSYIRFLTFVFCGGVIQLLFSFYYWGSPFFWMFVFLVINKNLLYIRCNSPRKSIANKNY